jgi:hypothetical protein
VSENYNPIPLASGWTDQELSERLVECGESVWMKGSYQGAVMLEAARRLSS